MKDSPQCEFTMPRGDQNNNGKRKPVTHITGKKSKNLSKKKSKLEKLQEVPGRTLQKESFPN
jgi:hypothetical protein